ncbi:MAG: ABC transporter permease subunit, partial [Planctomycetes bacterium]|nr:ABC transporter permease subunit [Planctomycetota bacterium]
VAAAAAELRRIEWRWIGNFVAGLAVPDVTPATLWSVLRNSITPLAIGVVATGLGALGAAMLTWPASVAFQLDAHRFTGERLTALGRARRWLLLAAAKLVALVCRAVPEVAWVVLLAVFFRLGVTPCVLAVALHTTGVLHRVFTETLDNLPYGELEKVGNGGRGQIFLYGGLPRAWPDWRTYVFFQFEVNVRAGVALGMVGAGGLGHAFAFSLDWRDYPTASTLLWAMVLLTVLIDRTSRRLQLRRREC